MTVPHKKKLIEVALPLEAINREAAREKSIRHGHPSTLHLWWARRPLAACRAVLFASLVDDPSAHPERFPTEEAQQNERERLFGVLEALVKWENTTDPQVLEAARAEILASCDGTPAAARRRDRGRVPAGWPRTAAGTAAGCGSRPSAASATSTPRSPCRPST